MISKFRYILIAFILINSLLKAQEPTKESVYSEITDIYKYIQQVSFDFVLKEEGFSGHLTAKKGNKYKMVVNKRVIICNGKTVWNYSPDENKVYISDFEEFEDQLSIDKIFFSFLNSFKPLKITEGKNEKGEKVYTLLLKTDKDFETTMNISLVELTINHETFDIEKFQINEPQKMTWIIKKLKLRKKSEDSLFEFYPPENCEIVDLR